MSNSIKKSVIVGNVFIINILSIGGGLVGLIFKNLSKTRKMKKNRFIWIIFELRKMNKVA